LNFLSVKAQIVHRSRHSSANGIPLAVECNESLFKGRILGDRQEWRQEWHYPLFYWVREKSNVQVEVDYVIEHRGQIIPVEVKSGRPGRLKSLFQFSKEKPASPLRRTCVPGKFLPAANRGSHPLMGGLEDVLDLWTISLLFSFPSLAHA